MADADISPKSMICQVCDTECERTSNRQKYCPECSASVEQQKSVERNKAAYTPKPKDIPCKECGEIFHKIAKCQRFCENCAKSRRLAKKRRRNKLKRIIGGYTVVGCDIGCSACGAIFTKQSANQFYCDDCGTPRAKKLRAKEKTGNWGEPPEAARYRAKKYRIDNPDRVKQAKREWGRSESGRAFYRNREAIRRLDAGYLLHQRISSQIRYSLKSSKAGCSTKDILSYSIDELRIHLERQFCNGMSWDNMEEWDIDHIQPRASFKFQNFDDDDFKACWALTNLRPLWRKENQEKSDKRIFLI